MKSFWQRLIVKFVFVFLLIVMGGKLLFAQTPKLTISCQIADITIGVNETTALTIKLDNVVSFYRYSMILRFDPRLVEIMDGDASRNGINASLGSFLQAEELVGNEVIPPNDLSIDLLHVTPTQADSKSGVLATVLLRRRETGLAEFKIVDVFLYDVNGLELPYEVQNCALGVVDHNIPSPTATATSTSTSTETATPSPMNPATTTATSTSTSTETATPSPVNPATTTPLPIDTATSPPIATPTVTATPTEIATASSAATATPSLIVPTAAAIATATETIATAAEATATPSPTLSPTVAATLIDSASQLPVPTPVATSTSEATATATATTATTATTASQPESPLSQVEQPIGETGAAISTAISEAPIVTAIATQTATPTATQSVPVVIIDTPGESALFTLLVTADRRLVYLLLGTVAILSFIISFFCLILYRLLTRQHQTPIKQHPRFQR